MAKSKKTDASLSSLEAIQSTSADLDRATPNEVQEGDDSLDLELSMKPAKEYPSRRIGILTSGGDAPGMNAAVVAVARAAERYNMVPVGIKRGFNGLLFQDEAGKKASTEELSRDTILDIADQPGTYLRTARCEEFKQEAYQKLGAANIIKELKLDGMVIIGGDGSYQGALKLCHLGVPCVTIPGTIDNDLKYTEMTLGYDTAVNCCVDAIRSIRATSRSHDRPHVVEVMGRNCGDIALKAAASTGSEIVIVPEIPWSVDRVAERLNAQIAKGNLRVTVVVAEGAYDSKAMAPFDVYEFLNNHPEDPKPCYKDEPMSSARLASVLKRKCLGADARHTVVGYVQRGNQPTAYDSCFGFEAGHLAVKLLYEAFAAKESHQPYDNNAIGIHKGKIFYLPIEEALGKKRRFNKKLYKLINHQE